MSYVKGLQSKWLCHQRWQAYSGVCFLVVSLSLTSDRIVLSSLTISQCLNLSFRPHLPDFEQPNFRACSCLVPSPLPFLGTSVWGCSCAASLLSRSRLPGKRVLRALVMLTEMLWIHRDPVSCRNVHQRLDFIVQELKASANPAADTVCLVVLHRWLGWAVYMYTLLISVKNSNNVTGPFIETIALRHWIASTLLFFSLPRLRFCLRC